VRGRSKCLIISVRIANEAIDIYLQPTPGGVWENSVTIRSRRAARIYEPGAWLPRVSPTSILMVVARLGASRVRTGARAKKTGDGHLTAQQEREYAHCVYFLRVTKPMVHRSVATQHREWSFKCLKGPFPEPSSERLAKVILDDRPIPNHHCCPYGPCAMLYTETAREAGGHDHGVAGLAWSVRVRPALCRERYRRHCPASFDGSGI
jgi:hypothetical protein